MENWVDQNNDGNWVKVFETVDAGGWGREGIGCGGQADQIITQGGPIATFRWDSATDVDFKNLSIREINAQGGPAATRPANSTAFKDKINLGNNFDTDSLSFNPQIDIAENGELNVVWNNEKISGAASTAAIDRIKEQNITAADSTITNLQPTIAFKKIATGTNGTYTTALLAVSPTPTPTTSTTPAITTSTTPTPTPTQIQTQADTDTEDTSPESDDNGESNDDDVEQ